MRKLFRYLLPLMFATIGLAQSAQPGRTGSSLNGQAAAPQDVLATFPAFTATGQTPAIDLVGNPFNYAGTNPGITSQYTPKFHTIQATLTGAPTTCTYHVYGTLKIPADSPVFPTDYVDMTGAKDCTTTGGQLLFITFSPVSQVVIQLSALTGGTSPTVAFRYLGTH